MLPLQQGKAYFPRLPISSGKATCIRLEDLIHHFGTEDYLRPKGRDARKGKGVWFSEYVHTQLLRLMERLNIWEPLPGRHLKVLEKQGLIQGG
jgi:hypothetical protein